MSIKLKANLNNPPISKYQQDAGCSDLQFPEEVHLVRLNPDGGSIYVHNIHFWHSIRSLLYCISWQSYSVA